MEHRCQSWVSGGEFLSKVFEMRQLLQIVTVEHVILPIDPLLAWNLSPVSRLPQRVMEILPVVSSCVSKLTLALEPSRTWAWL